MLGAHIEPLWRPLFTRVPDLAEPVVQVFVDPLELHFRTFEYILPLDHFFADLSMQWSPAGKHDQPDETLDLHTFGFELDHDSMEALLSLDRAGLYLTPLNRASRGGDRLIFHSAQLAHSLLDLVREQLPDALLEGFVHVNPVFRLNRFEPGALPFQKHHDAPFSDLDRGHISRYTMLIYLSGGESTQGATLRVEGHRFERFERSSCVVFHQSLEHEGLAFDTGVKLFLRTELIFEARRDELTHDRHLATIFSRACSLTTESLFDKEMATAVHALHDRAARTRWHGATPEARSRADEQYLYKTYGPHEFITDGCRYWFADARGEDLYACAALTVLDYFNCKLDDVAFRKLCKARKVKPTSQRRGASSDTAWPLHMLRKATLDAIDARDRKVGALDKRHLLPPLARPDPSVQFPEQLYELNDGIVRGFEETQYMHEEHILTLARARRAEFMERLSSASILMLGDEVFLDEERFHVHGNKLLIGAEKPTRPLNFAACSTYSHEPSDYVDLSETWQMPYLLLPPILFRRFEEGFELMCDFFCNGWMVTQEERGAVASPRLKWRW